MPLTILVTVEDPKPDGQQTMNLQASKVSGDGELAAQEAVSNIELWGWLQFFADKVKQALHGGG
jgi:hypothetical protein